jgi:serine/threonine protein kinase
VHRDIKPANIVYVGGVPKLADIGLVTDASDACSIVGTEGYIPPEGPGSPQADLYSLGKVLYEAATGKNCRDYPALPDDLRSWPDASLWTELNAVILRACAPRPRDRYNFRLASARRDYEYR